MHLDPSDVKTIIKQREGSYKDRSGETSRKYNAVRAQLDNGHMTQEDE